MGRRGDLSRSVFILLVLAKIATCVSETEINEGVTVEGVLVGGGEQAYVVSSYTDWQYYQFIFVVSSYFCVSTHSYCSDEMEKSDPVASVTLSCNETEKTEYDFESAVD